MNAAIIDAIPVDAAPQRRPPAWWQFLRRELAPVLGRTTRTLQTMLAITVVQLVSMTLEIPEASVSCFMVFFMIKENRVATLLAAVLLGVAFGVGIAATLFFARYTFDYPEWRVPAMTLATFAGMWLSRVFAVGPLAFAAGFIVAITQSIADTVPTAEAMVRANLWLAVALCYPAVVVYVVGTVLLPISPKRVWIDGISERLDLALAALRAEPPDRLAGRDLLDRATQGSATLLKLLGFAEKEDPRWHARHHELAATITASERVAASAAALRMATRRELSGEDEERARVLTLEIVHLKNSIRRAQLPAPLSVVPDARADSARLRELQLAVASLRDSLAGPRLAAPTTPSKKKSPVFKPDTLTNPDYVRFALKVTLAAMTCYVLYTAFDWPGTRTAYVTCCFIALETAGASMHKGMLRIVGCLAGALTGFLSLVYLIPHMTGIHELLLLSAVGAAVGGWLAAGSERTAYAGVQFGFAFFICIDQSYGPDVNFVPIRDRVVGILMGLAVSTVVYQFVWPDRATDRLRVVFGRALRNVSRLLLLSPADLPTRLPSELYDSVINDLGATQQLLDFALFEDQNDRTAALLASARPREMIQHAQAICLIATGLLGRSQVDEWRSLEDSERGADDLMRREAARALDRAATFVERGKCESWDDAASDGQLPPEAGDRQRSLWRLRQECGLLLRNCRAAGRLQ